MRSPFAVFRKNQKVLMVVLIGLSMFAFIFLDQLSRTGGEGLLPILGVMLGAGVFWVIGTQKGKATQYALTGALLGALVGIAMPRLGKTANAPVETNVGSLSNQQLSQFVRQRQLANQFLAGALGEAYSESPFIIQFLMPRFQFGFGRPLDQIEEDVVFGYLLQHEADQLGIVVSDNAVSEYVKQATNNKLSEGGFRGLLKRLGLGSGELYDILRNEIKARTVFQLLSPRTGSLQTPEQFWQDYRKVNLTQSLEVTAIPVDAFTSQVKEPNDGELIVFFDQYKNRFPNRTIDDDPIFGQPRRVRIAYIEADFETIEAAVPEVTDEEVQKFYSDNKETLYKIGSIRSDEELNDILEKIEGKKPLDPEFTPEKEGKVESGKRKAESGKLKDKEPSPTKKKPAKPEKTKSEKKKSEGGQAKLDTSQDDNELLALADNTALLAQAESGKADSKKSDSQPAKKKSTKKTSTEPEPPKLPESKQSGSDSAGKYRPLDDDLKSEIRDQLLREKTLNAMQTRIDLGVDLIRDKGFEARLPADDPDHLSASAVVDLLRKFAEKNQLRYVETGLLSALELQESEEHPIGQATEPVDNPFQRQNATTVIQELFGTETPQLYTAHKAVDALTDSRFAYWTIEDVEAHVPSFDDPGVKEQVLAAWKLKEARSAADERAKELAELVREADKQNKTMEAALAEQTITGKKDGLQLTIQPTPEFSWFIRTQPSAPSLNPLQQDNRPPLELSRIPGIEKVGNDFMETVFDDLQLDDVGVVSNADKTVYYVARVRERAAADPASIEQMRQTFLSPEQISSRELRFLAQLEQQQSNYEWAQEFIAKYGWDGQVRRPEQSDMQGSAGQDF